MDSPNKAIVSIGLLRSNCEPGSQLVCYALIVNPVPLMCVIFVTKRKYEPLIGNDHQ